ncbi:hypothetical protein DENSPDRAFT_830767 [Dentipellis sp. KUC8613]|nr:hypothetical protein DENSPDRAFT_830767 [Dentipellis sp. KUC8613]
MVFRALYVSLAALAVSVAANPLGLAQRDSVNCSDPRGPGSFLPHLFSASISNNGTEVTNSVAIDGSIVSFSWAPNVCRTNATFLIGAYTGSPTNAYSDGPSGSWIGPRAGPFGGFNATHHGSLVLNSEYFTQGQAYVVDLFEYDLATGAVGEAVANQDFSWEVPVSILLESP